LLFRRGLLVSLTNPQAVLHYGVFFVPFVSQDKPLAPQLVVIVPTAVGIVFLGYAAYVLLGSPLRLLLTSARRQVALNRVAGSFYVLTGLVLAVTGSRR
jgi:threonine/homoserine/homoserine lactone efflux protein